MFNTLFVQPLFNALVALYEYVAFQDLGVAIILLTIAIRVVLYPLFYKSFHNQAVIQKIGPEIKKIQHDHKDNKETQARALLGLYRAHKVNPFSSFLLIIVQLPILIALYKVFLSGISPDTLQNLYSFVTPPEQIGHLFINLIDLSKRSIIIVGLAAVFQYLHGRMALPKSDSDSDPAPAAKMAKQMVWIAPILTIVILFNLPAAVGLYWMTTSLFSIFQQIYINKQVYGTGKRDNSKDDCLDGV